MRSFGKGGNIHIIARGRACIILLMTPNLLMDANMTAYKTENKRQDPVDERKL